MTAFDALTDRLLESDEPSIALRTRLDVLREASDSERVRVARDAVRTSERVTTMLREASRESPYAKWYGAHWVLVDLAELGYPPGDPALAVLAERELDWLDSMAADGPSRPVADRYRRHTSFEGNALYSLLTLGLVDAGDARVRAAVRRLLEWQWPDGGWNCDRNPAAHVSSFHETVTPLRGLAAYVRLTNDAEARLALQRAAEVLLSRQLFRRLTNGEIMNRTFLELHYPCYWHYDVLLGLRVLEEAVFGDDSRTEAARAYLRTRQLPGGGWLADRTFWRFGKAATAGRSLVRWGPVGTTRTNEFVTVGALSVLTARG